VRIAVDPLYTEAVLIFTAEAEPSSSSTTITSTPSNGSAATSLARVPET
jgi:hypothetical protein